MDPAAPDAAALGDAAATLAAGGLVAFPTETFYGLAADARSEHAVDRLLDLKGRAESKPVLVLVDSIAMAESLVADVPPVARALMAAHWPGALTLVFRARPGLPRGITAGTGTVGVRLSSARVARGLVSALRGPVTAPSANPAGAAPPTDAAAALAYFEGVIEIVLDGGATAGGLASTVLDVTQNPPRLLRAGAVALGPS